MGADTDFECSMGIWLQDSCLKDGKPLTAASSDMNSVCSGVCWPPTCFFLPGCQAVLLAIVPTAFEKHAFIDRDLSVLLRRDLGLGPHAAKCSACLRSRIYIPSSPPKRSMRWEHVDKA